MESRVILSLPGLKFRPIGHPAHSQSLYRLQYPVLSKQQYHCSLTAKTTPFGLNKINVTILTKNIVVYKISSCQPS
jgi:hypothetical protein